MDAVGLPDHLSVSAVQTYRRCPAQWRRRYSDGITDPPSPQMAFGKAFALALEAHHRGEDGDVAFARAHAAAGNAVPGAVFGLGLLRLYRERFNLDGRPEQPFSLYLPDRCQVPVPIVGVMDLERTAEVVEFKTSRNPWSQARAGAEYQSAVYGWAFEERHGRAPDHVRYLVFSTRTGDVQEILTRPTLSELRQFELAAIAVWRGIVAGAFDGCGRCALCRSSSPTGETTYDWWPPTSGVTRLSMAPDLPPAPASHLAYWSRPGQRGRRL